MKINQFFISASSVPLVSVQKDHHSVEKKANVWFNRSSVLSGGKLNLRSDLKEDGG